MVPYCHGSREKGAPLHSYHQACPQRHQRVAVVGNPDRQDGLPPCRFAHQGYLLPGAPPCLSPLPLRLLQATLVPSRHPGVSLVVAAAAMPHSPVPLARLACWGPVRVTQGFAWGATVAPLSSPPPATPAPVVGQPPPAAAALSLWGGHHSHCPPCAVPWGMEVERHLLHPLRGGGSRHPSMLHELQPTSPPPHCRPLGAGGPPAVAAPPPPPGERSACICAAPTAASIPPVLSPWGAVGHISE